jgi:hypothetical protein
LCKSGFEAFGDNMRLLCVADCADQFPRFAAPEAIQWEARANDFGGWHPQQRRRRARLKSHSNRGCSRRDWFETDLPVRSRDQQIAPAPYKLSASIGHNRTLPRNFQRFAVEPDGRKMTLQDWQDRFLKVEARSHYKEW